MKYNTKIEYCLIEFKMCNQRYYCLWFSDEHDVFLINENDKLILFHYENEIRDFCKMNNLDIQSEAAVLYDIDAVIAKIYLKDIDCNLILRCWNITSDMAFTFKEPFMGDSNGNDNAILDVYNKLFFGTNPPTLKKDSLEIYNPIWEESEIHIIQNTINDSVRIFRKFLE